MFFAPEILFSFVLSSALFLFKINFVFLAERMIGEQFFVDNQACLFIALSIEVLGALGLLIFNNKFQKYKFRLLVSVILSILLFFLILIFYVAFYMRHGIGF